MEWDGEEKEIDLVLIKTPPAEDASLRKALEEITKGRTDANLLPME